MATIDVNIPDSALGTLAEQLVPLVKVELDIDKIEGLGSKVEDLEDLLIVRVSALEKRLEDIVATLRQASDRINLGLTY